MTMDIAYDYEHFLWLWTLPMTMNIAYNCDCDYEDYFLDHEHKPMPLIRKHNLLPMTEQGQLWLNTYDSWLGKCCLSFVTMKLGLNLIIYSVCSWFSLVLDCGNLPIKLGLPMFSNLFCLFLVLDRGNLPIKLGLPIFWTCVVIQNLFMPIIMSTLFHSIFGSFPIFYESRFVYNLGWIMIIRTVGMRFGKNTKININIVVSLKLA